MNVYKQAYDLTPVDLQKFPIWEYILEDLGLPEQDAMTVRPYLSFPPDPNNKMLIVRATFNLANNEMLKGFIKPIRIWRDPRWGEPIVPVDHSPVIVTGRGQVVFHYGTRKPDNEVKANNYILLGFTSHEVFPITYASDVEIKDCVLKGVINGFTYFDENQKGFEQIIRLKSSDIRVIT